MPALYSETSLFARLKAACADDWQAYAGHAFVKRLADGTLPEACFRHYLGQDYLFLIHLARAYALGAYKSDSLADLRAAAAMLSAIVDVEMGLHVKFCAGWGLTEASMAAAPEAPETMAYSRYVLERGTSGDILDLQVALAPCVIGYAEIGANLKADADTRIEGNPYGEWIEMYAGEEYQAVARGEAARLDRLALMRAGIGAGEEAGGEGRFPNLAATFRQATVLETAFWDMGLAAG